MVSLWVLVTAAFLMIHMIPGDPARAALGKNASPEMVASVRDSMGLNDSLWEQYGGFIGNLASGEFGQSILTKQPVSEIIEQRLPPTLQIALISFTVVIVVAVPLGLLMAALTRGGRRGGLQAGFTTATVLVAAIPEFLLSVCLVYYFAVNLGWLPVAGRDDASSYVLPVLSLVLGATAVMSRIVRVETLSVLGNDHIRTARAKRLPNRLVYLRHALPNALTATLTFGGMLLTGLMAGTVLVENVFAWPGLGTIIVQSIQQKDYPVVQALVLVYGAMTLLVNLLVDLALAALDPRSTIRED